MLLFSKEFRLAVAFTQPAFQWVWPSFPQYLIGQDVKLKTQLHLLLRLRVYDVFSHPSSYNIDGIDHAVL